MKLRKRSIRVDYRLSLIAEILDAIKAVLTPVEMEGELVFFTTIDGQEQRITKMFMKISDVKQVRVAAIKDKFGNAAAIDGKPAWALDNADLADLEVSEDGLIAKVAPKGLVGSFKLQCSADADLGEGVKPILAELQIDLLPGEAEKIELVVEDVPA